MLDLTAEPPTGAGRVPAWLWTGAAAALALLVLAGSLLGYVSILFATCVAAGACLTYLTGLDLSLEERLAYGTVLGAMAACVLTFPIAAAARTVDGPVVAAGFTLTAAVGAAAAAGSLPALRADLRSLVARWSRSPAAPGHPWPLAAVLVGWGAYWLYFMGRAYALHADGLYAGYVNIWGDWAAHLVYAGSFAYGSNFPPQFPIDPGHHLGYPFMIDFLAATLAGTGTSLTSALVLTSGLLGLAFAPVMYLAGLRLTGGRAAAAIATAVFLMGGGLGFVHMFQDLARYGPTILGAFPSEYTLNRDAYNIQWLNPVLAYVVPQRSTLFGFSLALLVPALLFAASRGEGRRAFPVLGVVAGVTPWFHVYAYGTVVALAVFWGLIRRDVRYLWFLVPALGLGVPAVLWLLPGTALPIRVQIGWMAGMDGHHDNVLWFWLWNLGLFIPALLAAQFWRGLLPKGVAALFAPVWLWFLVPNAVLLAPWEWDNTKFFVFWALLGALMVGALVARLLRSGGWRAALGAGLLITLCLSGGADLWRATNPRINSYLFTDTRGLQVGTWVRDHTPPGSVMLVATEHDEPVLDFGGRPVVLGFPGWVWSYGLNDWYVKQQDAIAMLRGDPRTPALLAAYRVSYVVIGPQETGIYGASLAYWTAHGERVYGDGEYSVFRVG